MQLFRLLDSEREAKKLSRTSVSVERDEATDLACGISAPYYLTRINFKNFQAYAVSAQANVAKMYSSQQSAVAIQWPSSSP